MEQSGRSHARKRNQNEIPLVVASERGRGQTESSNTLGVRTVTCMAEHSRMAWEGQSESVRITYAKCKAGKLYPEYCGTREIPWEYGGTTLVLTSTESPSKGDRVPIVEWSGELM